MESDANYVTFVLGDESKVVSRLTITEAMNLLPSGDFVRIHRSFIVNRKKINRIERHQLDIGGYIIPIGSAYSQHVR